MLQSGLSETPAVMKILADWLSDPIGRYANRLALDPELVRPWPFCNLLNADAPTSEGGGAPVQQIAKPVVRAGGQQRAAATVFFRAGRDEA